MKLVVGLGNPGTQYAATRHNIGWLVVDEVARRAGGVWRRDSKDAEVCEVRLGETSGTPSTPDMPSTPGMPGVKVLLVKPQTYMNASGKAVLPYLTFYKLEGQQLLVVQDDLDSPFGLLKLRMGGRHGGQNGVRDIIRLLGHEAFPRLKIGISRPPQGWNPADWVLSKWRDEEGQTLTELVRLGANAVEVWAAHDLQSAQGQFNSTDLRPKPPPQSDPQDQEITATPAAEHVLNANVDSV